MDAICAEVMAFSSEHVKGKVSDLLKREWNISDGDIL